mmetsp:Transcript_2985/g.9769  ORF Transcript_2985/g.9769 Transcript_2985/m.9769 type:complete len:289 (-) Transcript_2985:2101-2967(-)
MMEIATWSGPPTARAAASIATRPPLTPLGLPRGPRRTLRPARPSSRPPPFLVRCSFPLSPTLLPSHSSSSSAPSPSPCSTPCWRHPTLTTSTPTSTACRTRSTAPAPLARASLPSLRTFARFLRPVSSLSTLPLSLPPSLPLPSFPTWSNGRCLPATTSASDHRPVPAPALPTARLRRTDLSRATRRRATACARPTVPSSYTRRRSGLCRPLVAQPRRPTRQLASLPPGLLTCCPTRFASRSQPSCSTATCWWRRASLSARQTTSRASSGPAPSSWLSSTMCLMPRVS